MYLTLVITVSPCHMVSVCCISTQRFSRCAAILPGQPASSAATPSMKHCASQCLFPAPQAPVPKTVLKTRSSPALRPAARSARTAACCAGSRAGAPLRAARILAPAAELRCCFLLPGPPAAAAPLSPSPAAASAPASARCGPAGTPADIPESVRRASWLMAVIPWCAAVELKPCKGAAVLPSDGRNQQALAAPQLTKDIHTAIRSWQQQTGGTPHNHNWGLL